MSQTPWSEQENAAIVTDYFAMLAEDLSGRAYNKAAHNRRLQNLIERNRGAIEFKHQNISAVLKGMGEPWIAGYKPAFNYQTSLEDAVAKHLHRSGVHMPQNDLAPQIGDAQPALYIGIAPTQQNTPPPQELEQMQAIARKFDVAARDARNRALGKAGEARVMAHEIAKLRSEGRDDLAGKVRWVSDLDGDGAGYDIASFAPDGAPRLIEVKTTNGWERTPFHISRNELAVAERNRDSWHLMRLWNFVRGPKAFELRPPLEAHVELTATSFSARPH